MLSLKLNKIFKSVKLYENSLSVIFGTVFIVVLGVLVINYFSKNKSAQPTPSVEGEESALIKVHKVEKGEDLWKISEKYFGTGYKWVEIAKENKIENPGLIEAGQEIKIPEIAVEETRAQTQIQTQTQTPTPTQEQEVKKGTPDTSLNANDAITQDSYVVVKGDNLWKICVRAYGDGYKWAEIAKANNLKNPNLILPGMSLTLPR